jgi:hypothetical protein
MILRMRGGPWRLRNFISGIGGFDNCRTWGLIRQYPDI